MRVLLTGAAGFVGSVIWDRLTTAGHDTVGLDLLIPAAHAGMRPAWVPESLVVGDVRDAGLLDELLTDVDVVCHQAAMVGLGVSAADTPDYVSHNVFGIGVLLAAMARADVRKLVLASSMVVYGEGGYRCPDHGAVRPGARSGADLAAGRFEPPCPACGGDLAWHPIDESAPLDPRNTYAVTKVAQEHLAGAWALQVGAAVTVLRYHNIYGSRMPRDTPYAGVASIFRSALEAGLAPQLFEDGGQMRDFVHVQDVARSNVLAIERVGAAEPGTQLSVFNIASGHPRTVGDLATTLAVELGGPVPEVVGGGRTGDVRHIVAAPGRARTELGFASEVAWQAGISDFARGPMRAISSGLGAAGPRTAGSESDGDRDG